MQEVYCFRCKRMVPERHVVAILKTAFFKTVPVGYCGGETKKNDDQENTK